MKIEITSTGSLYDIVVPLRLSKENEWLKKFAIVGTVFDEWQKLQVKLLVKHITTGQNFKAKKEEIVKTLREFREKVKRLPDELNLGGRKLKKIFNDYLIALEKMHQSDDPVLQQTLEQVKFKVEFKEIRENWGNVSYTMFLHYESNTLHPLQFFYYVSGSYPEGIFFPSLVLLRTYDFSKYNREFRYSIKHNFNTTFEVSKAKNEKEVEKMILEILPKPAYTIGVRPKMKIKKVRERRWLRNKEKWIVNIESVEYDVRMPYVSGTISEEVLPQLEDLLILLPPHKTVNIRNIRGTEFVETPFDLGAQKQTKNKQKKKFPKPLNPQKPREQTNIPEKPEDKPNKPSNPDNQSNKPDNPKDKPESTSIQPVQPTARTIPMQWIIIGLGIVAFVVFWLKNRR
jgi:hypothetical protein